MLSETMSSLIVQPKFAAPYPLPLAGEGGERSSKRSACRVRAAALSEQAQNYACRGLPPHPRPLSPEGERGEEGSVS